MSPQNPIYYIHWKIAISIAKSSPTQKKNNIAPNTEAPDADAPDADENDAAYP